MSNLGNQNLPAYLDWKDIISGKDGQIYITLSDGTEIFLAEVDTFNAQMSMNNTSYQPIGQAQEMGIPISFSVTISMTEVVIRDDIMLEKLLSDLENGFFPIFDLQGKLRRRDGQEERVIYRDCVADGTVDLQNITPGEIIKRNWSFRCNSVPKMQNQFTKSN